MLKINLVLIFYIMLLTFMVSPDVIVKRDPKNNVYTDTIFRSLVAGLIFAVTYGFVERMSKCI